MMPTETSRKKSDSSNDPAGLKASIVKAIFNDLSPPRTRVGNASDLLVSSAGILSPSKKLADLSLSEGDLTLTDDYKTPIGRTISQNVFFPSDNSEKCADEESAVKDKPATKCVRKPKDVKEAPDSESSGRGPNTKQLAWLKSCRTGNLTECKKLLETDPDLLHYVPPHHFNYSAVHIATLGRHYELLRFLKSKDVNFNAQTRTGYTPLHLAAQNQDQETARLLIREFGVDTSIPDLLGYTYEHYADWLDYPDYDYPRLTCYGTSSCMGSQESLSSSKTSFSRNGSLRDTIRGILHVPIAMGLRSRSPSLNQLAV
ncbi:hypothetical protein GCK32_010448 [Trichostrongylus colubriformis]|uniref:Uncharacterized protein n=1 Tax=Trichostrongylus colubriformis TaxID=6319 RepID=A0AAN8F2C9_TRICO